MIRRPGTAVAGDRTNKTIAIACVALLIFTVTYVMITSEDGSDTDAETIRILADDCLVVNGGTTHSNSEFDTYSYIYVKGTSIVDNAFKNCTKINTVYLSSDVKTIGNNAFLGCTGLYSIEAPNVVSIGNNAFKDSGLRVIIVGSALTSIGANAFENTSRLYHIPLWSTSVTEIKDGTFMNSGLKFVDLRSIETLSSTAFSGSSLSLQMVKTGQTVLVPGICRLYCDDDDIGGKTGSPIKYMYQSGNEVSITFDSQYYVSIIPVNGDDDVAEHYYSTPYYRAKFTPTGTTDYVMELRHIEIYLPEGLGVDPLILLDQSDLPYTLPTATAGELTFSGWKAEGTSGFVTQITRDLANSWGGRVVLTAVFGKADMVMDHSAISDRTDVSSLSTRIGFTYGDHYNKLSDVEGYTHVGWLVDGVSYAADAEIAVFKTHTAYSVWEATKTYKLTYLQSDGSVLSEATIPYNMTIVPDMTLDVTEEIGKRLIGWSKDGITASATIRVDDDMSVKPVFEDREVFRVTVMDRGNTLSGTDVYDGRTYTFQQEDPFSETLYFLGWTDGIVSGTEFAVESNITIESQWRDRAQYTVSYRDGWTVIDNATAFEGIPFEIAIDDPSQEGKRFDGWYSEDGEKHVRGDKLDVSADTELYTGWSDLPKYTVTVTDRGSVLESVEVYSGSTYTFSHEAPSAEGMVFVGWKCAGAVVEHGQQFVIGNSITITSEWRLPYRFSIIFSDGIGTDRTFSVTEGSSMTIDFANPVSEDWIFAGWKGPDGTVRMYGDVVSPENSMTFNAQWSEREEHKVTYLDNGSEVGTAIAKEGIAFTVRQDMAPKTGYKFLGWAFGEKILNIGDSLEIEENVTMTASWEALDVFTVKYVDGDEILDESTGYDGDRVTIEFRHPEKEGFVFLTWEIDGAAVADGTVRTLDSNMVVEAAWRALDEFTVTFMDGEKTIKIVPCKEGDEVIIAIDDPVSVSKDFRKWTDGTASYLKGDRLSLSDDVVLTAVWEDKEVHKVVFMNGESKVAEATGYHGSRFTIDVEDPVCEGKVFAGWSCQNATYVKGSSLALEADATLEAVWTDKAVHTVSYYSEGEIKGTAKVVDGSDMLLDKKLDRDGYCFKGWSLTDGGKVSKLNGDTIRPTGDIALYAVWEEISQPSPDEEKDADDADKDSGIDGSEREDKDKDTERDDGSGIGFTLAFDNTTLAIGVGVAAMVISLLAVAVRRS